MHAAHAVHVHAASAPGPGPSLCMLLPLPPMEDSRRCSTRGSFSALAKKLTSTCCRCSVATKRSCRECTRLSEAWTCARAHEC